ncbi:MAG: redoxin domain-containing protein [Verrucomicrobia bacterium]|nr:redoxin domain-containing protein [Kiritimatiellia bacterium]MCB1101303.1 redoxin domain-containing protein [Kiritimatiellia bacterium]MCP5487156.1 redoxin domain-containing protein [Verrucomicrobiota bacterium]
MNQPTVDHLAQQLSGLRDQRGTTIHALSMRQPLLLVLLRHIGCPFCRKVLHELSESLPYISDCGYSVGLVHMNDEAEMTGPLTQYGLLEVPRFYDPERRLYQALGLPRAQLRQALNIHLWKEGVRLRKRYGFSTPKADPLQLPGAFLVDQGKVVAGEPVMTPDESPDFLALLIRSEAVA